MISPFEILSPSNTDNVLCLGINISVFWVFLVAPSGDMTSLIFPFVSLPKEMIPVSSDKTAASLGFLASNRSATLGKPPVISFVFDATRGILAIISPAVNFWPSLRFTSAPAGKVYVAGTLNSPIRTGLFLESTIDIVGTSSLPAEGLSDTSITSMLDSPVRSSICSLTVTPSSISENLTFPDVSPTIGLVYGSHDAILMLSLSSWLFLTSKVAP